MGNFQDLALRTRILLALAGLTQENKHNGFFSAKEICKWFEDRTGKLSDGRKRALSRKLKEMRGGNTITVEDEYGNQIGEVKVLSITLKKPYLYKIGERTGETQLSAKLLKRLHEACPVGGSLPKKSEDDIIDEIYNEFKSQEEYKLSRRGDVAKKIEHAVASLYFIRDEDGHLRATRRLSIDEADYIERLSSPLPKPVHKSNLALITRDGN